VNNVETLFTWIHISDIHYRHGDARHQKNQQRVLKALAKDLKEVRKDLMLQPNALLVTGDLAFSGKIKYEDEYEKVEEWLTDISIALGVSNEH